VAFAATVDAWGRAHRREPYRAGSVRPARSGGMPTCAGAARGRLGRRWSPRREGGPPARGEPGGRTHRQRREAGEFLGTDLAPTNRAKPGLRGDDVDLHAAGRAGDAEPPPSFGPERKLIGGKARLARDGADRRFRPVDPYGVALPQLDAAGVEQVGEPAGEHRRDDHRLPPDPAGGQVDRQVVAAAVGVQRIVVVGAGGELERLPVGGAEDVDAALQLLVLQLRQALAEAGERVGEEALGLDADGGVAETRLNIRLAASGSNGMLGQRPGGGRRLQRLEQVGRLGRLAHAGIRRS
jgi:hypothetical protein